MKHFQRYEQAPVAFELIVQSWDPAMVDAETSAFTVCTTWGIVGRRVYLLDVFRHRLDFYQVAPAIRSMQAKYKADFVILEITGLGTPIANALCQPRPPWLMTTDPDLGKVERAIAERQDRAQARLPADHCPPGLRHSRPRSLVSHTKYFDQVNSMVQFLRAFDIRNRMTNRLSAMSEWPKLLL